MKFQSLMYPAPSPSTYSAESLENNLIYVPRFFHHKEIKF